MALKYADWARIVSLTAGIWSTWAAIWGILFRKFFFDMIGGELGPAGLIPPKSSAFFIKIIVDIPLVQIFTIIGGLFVLAFDWPLPFLEKTVFSRSPVFKMAFHFVLGFLSLLLYQAFDAAFVSFLALAIYAKSYSKGEHLRTESKNGSGGGEA